MVLDRVGWTTLIDQVSRSLRFLFEAFLVGESFVIGHKNVGNASERNHYRISSSLVGTLKDQRTQASPLGRVNSLIFP